MFTKIVRFLREIVSRAIFHSRRVAPDLELLLLVGELVGFMVLVPLNLMSPPQTSFDSFFVVTLALISLIVVKILTGVSLLSLLLAPLLSWVLQCRNSGCLYSFEEAVLLGLFSLSAIIDTSLRIQFNYTSQSIYAETINSSKVLHLCVLTAGVVMKSMSISFRWLEGVIGLVLFLLCTALKKRSSCASRLYRDIMLVFYVTSACCYIALLVGSFISLKTHESRYIGLGLSLLACSLMRFGNWIGSKRPLLLEERLSQGMILDVCFDAMATLSRYSIFSDQAKQIKKLAEENTQMKEFNRKGLIDKIINLLEIDSKTNNRCLLLLAQVLYYERQVFLRPKRILEELASSGQVGLMMRLHLKNFEKQLITCMEAQQKTHKNFSIHAYLQMSAHSLELLRSAKQYLRLWRLLSVVQLSHQEIYSALKAAVIGKEYVQKMSSHFVCEQSLRMWYISYLYNVTMDVNRANELRESLYVEQDILSDLQLHTKVYIRLRCSLNSSNEYELIIDRVGANVSRLIGFSRLELVTQSYLTLLPLFYHQTHSELMHRRIEAGNGPSSYCKCSIVRTNSGSYILCRIGLKLASDQTDGNMDFYYQGFIQTLVSGRQKGFIFCDAKGDIIETSPEFNSLLHHYYADGSSRLKHFSSNSKELTVQLGATKYLFIERLILSGTTSSQDYKFYCLQERQSYPTASSISTGPRLDLVVYEKHTPNHLLTQYYSKETNRSAKLNKIAFYWPGALIFMVILVFGLQIGLMVGIPSKMNEINETIQIDEAFYTLFLQGGRLTMEALTQLAQAKEIAKLNRFQSFLQQCVQMMQRANERVGSFSRSNHNITLPTLGADITFTLSGYSFISSYYTSMQIYPQLKSTSQSKQYMQLKIVLKNSDRLHNQVLPAYIQDYEAQWKKGSKEGRMAAVVITTLFAICLLASVVYLKRKALHLDHKIVINIAGTNSHLQLIQNVKAFLDKIATTDNAEDAPGYAAGSQALQQSNSLTFGENSMLSPSGSLDVSFRDSGSLNESAQNLRTLSATGQSRKKQAQLQSFVSKRVIHEPKLNYKLFILGGLLICGCLIGCLYSLVVFHFAPSTIDPGQSRSSLVKLIMKSTIFTNFVSSYFCETLLAKEMLKIDTFGSNIKSLATMQADLLGFSETYKPQFEQFNRQISDLRYNYICNYTKCDADLAPQVNLALNTLIQKLVGGATKADGTSNYPSIKFQDLLVACDELIRTAVYQATAYYIDGYRQYISQNLTYQPRIQIIGCATSLLFFILVTIMAIQFRRRVNLGERISNLIRSEDFERKS